MAENSSYEEASKTPLFLLALGIEVPLWIHTPTQPDPLR